MNLEQLFEGISKKMLADFHSIHSQVKHPGGKGSMRETAFSKFLSDYLPKRYSISSGEIFDSSNHVSKQCDIIIYDALSCPMLLSSDNYRIFPCEPVFGVIEVKSNLNKKTIKQAVENIREVKKLKRDNGIVAGVLFGYTSSYAKNSIFKVAEILDEFNKNLQSYEMIDAVCVLDSGTIFLYDESGNLGVVRKDSDRTMMAIETTPPPLLWFHIHLLELLANQISSDPNYLEYSNLIEIGFARKIS